MDEKKLFFSRRNSKLGKNCLVYNFSSCTECESRRLGLCSVGSACYGLQLEKFRSSVLLSLRKNEMSQDAAGVDAVASEFIQIVNSARNPVTELRFSVFGDIRNADDIEIIDRLSYIGVYHGITSWLYTARRDLADELMALKYCRVLGSGWPAKDGHVIVSPAGTAGNIEAGGHVYQQCPGKCYNCSLCKTGYTRVHFPAHGTKKSMVSGLIGV